jgi:hypothetical protein
MNKVGIAFASTGGYKTVRAIETFRKMEPDFSVHVVIDVSSRSWRERGKQFDGQIHRSADYVKYVENHAHINGTLNRAVEWLRDLECSHACLFQDDIVFSPFELHVGSMSRWFTDELLSKSGITFPHFECYKIDNSDPYARRHPSEWDQLDLTSDILWQQLMTFQRNGSPIYPRDADWYCKYEGPDKLRKWNRLGPTGSVIPIATWELLGGFDEREGLFYDQEYASECFRRKLPPIYAVPAIPWLHLHNQSMNPWFDAAPGPWSDTMSAYAKRFGTRDATRDPWAGFWLDTWEEEWRD